MAEQVDTRLLCTNASLRDVAERSVLGSVVIIVGFKIGGRYIHLCDAGLEAIEWSAFLLTPLIAGLLVTTMRSLWISLPLAFVILTTLAVLLEPYLAWTH